MYALRFFRPAHRLLRALTLGIGLVAGMAAPEALATSATGPLPALQSHPRAAEATEIFYLERGLQPFWLEQGKTARAETLLAWLDGSISHGIPAERYGASELRGKLIGLHAESAPDARMALDRAMTAAFLRFANDLGGGMLDPDALDIKVHLRPRKPDPLRLLRGIATAPDLRASLDGLSPPDPRYRTLREAVQHMLDMARNGGWGAPIKSSGLTPGEVSVAADALRRRLIATGDLPPEPELAVADEQPTVAAYDARLMAAVARFQDRHGLAPDGIAGPATLRELNRPLEHRIAQAMLNLERMRWRALQRLGRRIEVNQAAFLMTVYGDDGTALHQARVVVGQPERRLQTPEFSRMMSYLVLNPRWTVPKSIIVREMLPEAKADPSFFERSNMILSRRGRSIDPATIDWEAMTPEIFSEFGVVQKPGPGNALGNVKFMFPNGHNIYLHDTPSKHLFASTSRAFSHGCVRVERPFALAWLLLSEQSEDPGAEIERILATGEETEVPLEKPIPVHLFYLTAWVDHQGRINFRQDIYGRDKALAQAIQAASSADQQTSGL